MASAAAVGHIARRGLWRAWRVAPLAYAAIALLPIIIVVPFLHEPMEQDEGVYFSMALSGELPYVSVFDHKPPLIYGWYKLALLLNGGGADVAVVRLLAAVHLSIAALAAAWIGTLLGGRKVGMIAGLVMASTSCNQYLQANANTEVFMLAPLLGAVGCFVTGTQRGGLRWFALAGALCGMATMTKTVGVLNFAAFGGVLIWALLVRLERANVTAMRMGALAAGFSAVSTAIIAPFAAGGHWSAFWHANVTYNVAYSAQSSITAKMFALASVDAQVLAGSLAVWALGAAGVVLLCQRGFSQTTAAVLASGLAAYLGASVTGREYAHYWVPVAPFAAICAAVTIERLLAAWRSTRHRVHAEALLLALALPSIFVVVPLYLVSPDDAHLRKYAFEVNAQRAVENEELAAQIAAMTAPGDRIFNFGVESQLYVLSGREPATYYTRPIAALQSEPATFERTMAELRAAPPELIVDSARISIETSNAQGLAATGAAFDVDPRYRAPFDAFLRERYDFAGRVAYADLYVLRR